MTFTTKFRSEASIFGLFIKTAAAGVVEICGAAGFDFLVLDAEHAAFPISTVDALVPVARSVATPLLVRTPGLDPAFISAALDCGVDGVLVPRIENAEQARRTVAAARFAYGQRGFSPSPRCFAYGADNADDARARADARILVLAQIETASGLENLSEIASVEGLDGLFFGPADMAASFNVRLDDVRILEAARDVANAALEAGKRFGAFISRADLARAYQAIGANFFIAGSDQALLATAARATTAGLRDALTNGEEP